jgi:hypothetical protein
MPVNKQILLNQQLDSIPFSIELKQVCTTNDIHTLEDLLELEVYNWHKKLKGFNYHHQYEVVSYLMENDLMKFVKEE